MCCEKIAGEVSKKYGIVAGKFGEVSQQTHFLMASMANSRSRVADPSRGRRGHLRSEEEERAMAISARRLGLLMVRCQTLSLPLLSDVGGTPGSWSAAGGESSRQQPGQDV